MDEVTPVPQWFLHGQILIAMPGMTDPRFGRAVIYLCAHSADGAMGIRVNQTAPVAFADVLERLDLRPRGEALRPPVDGMQVYQGGPVETGRGFVLHSADYEGDGSTLVIDDRMRLTSTIDILRAIVAGAGPRHALFSLGYAGWGPGQLEDEIQANGWLHCPATPELVFDLDVDGKYERALAGIGVFDPRTLSATAGHA